MDFEPQISHAGTKILFGSIPTIWKN